MNATAPNRTGTVQECSLVTEGDAWCIGGSICAVNVRRDVWAGDLGSAHLTEMNFTRA